MSSGKVMKTPPAQQTSAAQKPRQAQTQMRALLRGDLRMFPLLMSKVIAALRARYYLRRCTKVGRYVRVYGRPFVQNDGVIEIGDNVLIFSTTVRVEFVAVQGGRLEIGAESSVNYGFSAAAHQLVHIGKRCSIGPYVNIIDNNYHDVLDRSRKPPSRPVIIGDDVWIAARVIILPGVTIGDHAVISAGAIVTESVPERSVAAGNPAQIIAQF
jgi:acetyltransferase-like isoleucine patch superfamily enzyme